MVVVGRIGRADAQLVNELYPDLRRFAGVVAPWDMDPDDVLHAALVNILRNGRLHTIANPGAYFRRAIVNHIKSEIRRSQTRRVTLRRLRGSAVGSINPTYPSDVAELMRLRPVER
ncbi:MAG: sigma-70 family RNA polymerase sigma factor, partial [bacterium]|nr:sigma-70 family RNA polymerase sigma factor [bacterium]